MTNGHQGRNRGFDFRIYNRQNKTYKLWTGPFGSEICAHRWFKKYGLYWNMHGYTLALFKNGLFVKNVVGVNVVANAGLENAEKIRKARRISYARR